jgi:hypothetical protein
MNAKKTTSLRYTIGTFAEEITYNDQGKKLFKFSKIQPYHIRNAIRNDWVFSGSV